MSMPAWPTTWLPRPIEQRAPIRTTGPSPMSWPGAMPAERLTCGPINVPSPMLIQRSPNTAPGGKAIQLPAPKAANFPARALPGVTAPVRESHAHDRWTADARALWAAALTSARLNTGARYPTNLPSDP